MSEPGCRPRDVLAFFFGIVLPEQVGHRLDQGITRVVSRLPGLLYRDEVVPPGFAATAETKRDV